MRGIDLSFNKLHCYIHLIFNLVALNIILSNKSCKLFDLMCTLYSFIKMSKSQLISINDLFFFIYFNLLLRHINKNLTCNVVESGAKHNNCSHNHTNLTLNNNKRVRLGAC